MSKWTYDPKTGMFTSITSSHGFVILDDNTHPSLRDPIKHIPKTIITVEAVTLNQLNSKVTRLIKEGYVKEGKHQQKQVSQGKNRVTVFTQVMSFEETLDNILKRSEYKINKL